MQVSTRLKLGVMWDHNGTYMDGIGFQYRDHRVTVEITQDDQIAGIFICSFLCISSPGSPPTQKASSHSKALTGQ